MGLTNQGHVEVLEVARDEFYLPNDHGGLKKIPVQADIEALLQQAEVTKDESGAMPQLVFYPPGTARTTANRRILNGRIMLHAATVAGAVQAATDEGCEKARPLGRLAGYAVAEIQRMPGASLLAAAALSQRAGITTAQPMLGGGAVTMAAPTYGGTFFGRQWHLKNTQQSGGIAGIDANVVPVWSEHQGEGVVIAIVDDGVENTHPDIAPRYQMLLSYDFLLGIPSATPKVNYAYDSFGRPDNHGTSVAGLAAGAGGGIYGAAPQASLAGIRLVGGGGYPSEDMEIEALSFQNDLITIKNNSWGFDLDPAALGELSLPVQETLKEAALHGRGGKGVIMTFAAGNSYINPDPDTFDTQEYAQGNKSGWSNNMHVFAVGAVNASGGRACYSETGAHLLTCAPADGGKFDPFDPSIVTTDRSGALGYNDGTWPASFDLPDSRYTSRFGGTSAATAVASGVIALMLEANPGLGWRDVKEILLRTGVKVDPHDPDWVSRTGGSPSLPPLKHNHQYGGGMVNGVAAVALAKTWRNLGEMSTLSWTSNDPLPIPDYSYSGATVQHDFSSEAPLRVEHVEVVVDMRHTCRGDVSIDLISPSGTVSQLAHASYLDHRVRNNDDTLSDAGYPFWTFSSTRHWGESSLGTWKVVFRDLAFEDTGTVESVEIRLHGAAAPKPTLAEAPQDAITPIGNLAEIRVVPGGAPDFSYVWLKGAARVANQTTATLLIATMNTAAAGQYAVQISNLTGMVKSAPVNLGAVDTASRSFIFNEKSSFALQATAAGPGIRYQWKKKGVVLSDESPHLTGTSTSRLTLKGITKNDAADYACEVTVGTAVASTGTFHVEVRVKPVIAEDFEFVPSIVSGSFTLQIPIIGTETGVDGHPTRYVISGLPSGVTYNASTGVITGVPNVGGSSFTIKITAINAAGSSTTVTKLLTIAKLPLPTVGTFNGLVDADSFTNGSFGGTVTVITAATGAFSGRLTLGSAVYALSGRMKAAPDSDPSATLSLRRAGKAAPLKVAFAISRTDGHLTGTVQDTSLTATTGLDAWHNPYSALNRAGDVAAVYNAWIDPPAAATILSADDDTSSPLLMPVTHPAAPEGTSFALMTVNSLGAVTWVSRLADHTLLTRSTTIGETGSIPEHFMLYGNRGSFRGWVQLAAPSSSAVDSVNGAMRWLRNPQPAASTTRSYKSGFLLDNMPVTGSSYAKPASGHVLWGLSNVGTMPNQSNARLMFAKAGLELAANCDDVSAIDMRVLTSGLAQKLPPNPTVLRMKVTPANGVFGGTAVLKDTVLKNGKHVVISRFVLFYGLIRPSEGKGRGYFLLSQLPDAASSPQLSGTVELTAGSQD
ncbi:MAG: propanediol utilization protein [Verrucomicrobiaceae bacterium]|nr:propanediol utilization protein [Verrucomicrobiaceae bacterium]